MAKSGRLCPSFCRTRADVGPSRPTIVLSWAQFRQSLLRNGGFRDKLYKCCQTRPEHGRSRSNKIAPMSGQVLTPHRPRSRPVPAPPRHRAACPLARHVTILPPGWSFRSGPPRHPTCICSMNLHEQSDGANGRAGSTKMGAKPGWARHAMGRSRPNAGWLRPTAGLVLDLLDRTQKINRLRDRL